MHDFNIKPDRKAIAPDKGMPSSGRGRPMSPVIRGHVERFAAMKPGESFFVEGAESKDLEFLRKPFLRAGLGMLLRHVQKDEIYKTNGVRIWRLAGEYDEL